MALGILALLTMLVVSFAMLTRVETSAAVNYREGERARTLAKSGIERAQAELRRAVTSPGYPVPWLCYDAFDYQNGRRFSAAEQLAQTRPSLLDVGQDPQSTSNLGVPGTRSPSLGMYFDPANLPEALQLDGTKNQDKKKHISLPWPSGVLGST